MYREVQIFPRAWLIVLVAPATAVALLLHAAYQQIVRGIPVGGRPATDSQLLGSLAITAGALLLVAALLFSTRLITEVNGVHILLRYIPLWRRTLRLDDVASSELVNFRPFRDFGGWGIRRGRSGWAFTVRGTRGVRLTFRSGTPLVIGSQEPERLYQSIEAARRGEQI
jgi:hypothetical protein